MPIIKAHDGKSATVQLGSGDVYIATGEDTEHNINSLVFIHHDVPHRVGEHHRELEGRPITDFDNTVIVEFTKGSLHSIDIVIENLVVIRNCMKGLPDIGTLEQQLLRILMEHCGERGDSEGAVETLQRIIDERNRAALGMPIIQNVMSPVHNG